MDLSTRVHEICRTFQLPAVDVVAESPGGTSEVVFRADSYQNADLYLVASLTKPIVAMAVVKLASEGLFSLADRPGQFLPAFNKAAYRRITIRHLLTHTSGFPDMVPENAELRAAHASLDNFLAAAAETDLQFVPGRSCRYSSIGFLVLGGIIESVTGMSTSAFLQQQFFEPLEMRETWLGIPADVIEETAERIVPCGLPAWQPDADTWGWNSNYWRTLGAPWGGLISTAQDLGRFCRMILAGGVSCDGRQILPESAVTVAIADQIRPMAAQPDFSGSPRAWGFGWRHLWPDHSTVFGDFLPEGTVGHWGATGTLFWLSPSNNRWCVALSSVPFESSQSALQRISNVTGCD